MFPAISSGSFIIAQGRADAWKFIGHDGRADARSVDNHATRRLAPCDSFCHLTRDVGIVGRLLFVDAYVIDVEAKLFEDWLQFLFEREAAVIGTERYGLSRGSAGVKLVRRDFHQLDATVFGKVASGWRDDGAGRDLELAGFRNIGLGDDFSH